MELSGLLVRDGHEVRFDRPGWLALTGGWRRRDGHVRSQAAWQPPTRYRPWPTAPGTPSWRSGMQRIASRRRHSPRSGKR